MQVGYLDFSWDGEREFGTKNQVLKPPGLSSSFAFRSLCVGGVRIY